MNEAAIVAVRDSRDTLTAHDFDEARDRLLLGRREATNALLPDEKHAVAVHESGHALVAALSAHADPVAKVTIPSPRAGPSAVTEGSCLLDERHLYSESYLKASLAVRLGGRVAENLVIGEASTGASSDLAGATDVAVRMVREYGMSKRLGPIGFASGSPMYLGGEEVRSRSYAEDTQRVIDEEVEALLREAEQRATALLSDHRDALDRLVEDLLAHETVDGSAVAAAIKGESGPTGPAESGGLVPAIQYQARAATRAAGATATRAADATATRAADATATRAPGTSPPDTGGRRGAAGPPRPGRVARRGLTGEPEPIAQRTARGRPCPSRWALSAKRTSRQWSPPSGRVSTVHSVTEAFGAVAARSPGGVRAARPKPRITDWSTMPPWQATTTVSSGWPRTTRHRAAPARRPNEAQLSPPGERGR